ncbi:SLC13 family permease [Nocardiopsis dassonvillei]|uniref:SLC13 family permease n=1 Tax=Nocardiopsis dassonvillei TaxID=2014 RepID=UPI00200EA8D8|nr:SLC13 family permease [Nocardiopsis dassonvillei]MCK9869408.1 SLC13 family permease [Nocardiopsis dassonvillei]
MTPQLLTILVLLAMFVIATVLPINIGALAFVAAFMVGLLVLGMDADAVLGGFPADLFLTLVGVTYLFAIAKNNGTIDLLVRGATRMVGGRVAAIPWIMFGISAVLTGVGALGPAAVAIVAPIALSFAARYRINPLLMGMMVVHGAQGGGFSPVSVYGVTVNGIVADSGLSVSPITLFLGSLVFNLGIALILFVSLGGNRLFGLRAHEAEAVIEQIATLVGIVALGVLALGVGLDVGFVALTVSVVLALIAPQSQKDVLSQISWSTVLLITGMLTFVGVMESAGTIEYVGDGAASLGAPLLVALLLCYIGAVVSAFASSTAILGATIPLAIPFLLMGDISATGVIVALAISSTIVDVSPFSTNGALVLANATGVDPSRFYRQMLIYSGIVVLVGPLVAWGVLVVPGLL